MGRICRSKKGRYKRCKKRRRSRSRRKRSRSRRKRKRSKSRTKSRKKRRKSRRRATRRQDEKPDVAALLSNTMEGLCQLCKEGKASEAVKKAQAAALQENTAKAKEFAVAGKGALDNMKNMIKASTAMTDNTALKLLKAAA